MNPTPNVYGARDHAGLLATLIQTELATHKIHAAVAPVFNGPQWRTFLVRGAFGTDPRKVHGLNDAIAHAAGLRDAYIATHDEGILVMLPKRTAERRALSADALARLDLGRRLKRSEVVLGINPLGRPVLFDFAQTPHAAALGITGSGKTTLLQWVAYRLCAQNAPEALGLVMLSPKHKDLVDWPGVAHLLHPPTTNPYEVKRVLLAVVSELDRRNATGQDRPRWLVCVDEIPDLLDQDGQIDDLLNRIAQIGRDAGIHLLVGSQRADQASIGRLVFNVGARFVGQLGSATAKFVTTGRAGTDADRLLGRGDFLFIHGGQQERFQAPWLPDLAGLPTTHEERRLELPEPFAMPARGGHGGWNRKELDPDQWGDMCAMFAAGASDSQVSKVFSINRQRVATLRASWESEDQDL